MKRLPYFHMYPTDFMNGVRGLSAQDVGVYTMILCRIYEEGGPVAWHPERLATYCGMRVKAFEMTAGKLARLGKLHIADGMVKNARAEVEIKSRTEAVTSASRAGKISAEKRNKIMSHDQRPLDERSTQGQRPFNHTDTDRIETDVSILSEGKPSAILRPQIADPVKVMFDSGIQLLGQAGTPPDRARAIIGGWRKRSSTEAVIAAMGRAQREGAIEPIAFIEGALKATANNGRSGPITDTVGGLRGEWTAMGFIPEE